MSPEWVSHYIVTSYSNNPHVRPAIINGLYFNSVIPAEVLASLGCFTAVSEFTCSLCMASRKSHQIVTTRISTDSEVNNFASDIAQQF